MKWKLKDYFLNIFLSLPPCVTPLHRLVIINATGDFSISLSFPLLSVYAHVISGIAVVEMQTRFGLVK